MYPKIFHYFDDGIHFLVFSPDNINCDFMTIMTRGFRNQNPFNIKLTKQAWKGKVPNSENTDGTFEQFKGIMFGLRAGLLILRTYYKKYGCRKMFEFIERFAPATENDVTLYVNYVYKWMNCFIDFDMDDDIRLSSEAFYLMAQGMCMYESEYCPSLETLKSIKL